MTAREVLQWPSFNAPPDVSAAAASGNTDTCWGAGPGLRPGQGVGPRRDCRREGAPPDLGGVCLDVADSTGCIDHAADASRWSTRNFGARLLKGVRWQRVSSNVLICTVPPCSGSRMLPSGVRANSKSGIRGNGQMGF